ncbi:AAA family ATPase [Argonema antarcticum]|uniref:AAA family ATPase n=1 Tax=Argonema antarcticum TaxID=2942763 RepID=UPI002012C2C4|nr:AAA family ATPase [Argonema antarcticum]MCL1471071.1 AAA family ATPase [Argonema antarcticum A004/B2]
MSNQLTRLQIKNFRSLADVDIATDSLNILFGPNGSGKSTFLDTIWFVRDCAINGVETASSERSHGIGALWDGADEGANISITIHTDAVEYEVVFGYSSGRIEPFVGEKLYSKSSNICLIDRKLGSDKVGFYNFGLRQQAIVELREPEKLALSRYVYFEEKAFEASEFDKLLHFVHRYHSRSADLFRIKNKGSDSSYQTWLWERCQNLWSVLRNLQSRRMVDDRYDTIVHFMKESFPSFNDILIETTGPTTVYGSFLDKGRHQPILASGVSDGHLQMLIHLTALFAEGANRDSLILFDEPEISLHPWALAVFAKAAKLATEKWNKQVFIATHSPVLISQFDTKNIWAATVDELGKTEMKRVSEMENIQDLLEEYATGSLYMAEMIAPQSKSPSGVQSE